VYTALYQAGCIDLHGMSMGESAVATLLWLGGMQDVVRRSPEVLPDTLMIFMSQRGVHGCDGGQGAERIKVVNELLSSRLQSPFKSAEIPGRLIANREEFCNWVDRFSVDQVGNCGTELPC